MGSSDRAAACVARRPRPEQAQESDALLTGVAAFVLGFLVSLAMFWHRTLAITGSWSVGAVAAIGGAVVAVLGFALGRIALRRELAVARRRRADPDALAVDGQRLRWYELTAIALAHGASRCSACRLAALLEAGFRDAPVFPFPGAVLVGVALALTAYVCSLSAAVLSPSSISLILSVFLVIGALTAMLEATDPHWWRLNLSALGMVRNASAPAFNGTLIVAGVMVTTIARYATAALPVRGVPRPPRTRRRAGRPDPDRGAPRVRRDLPRRPVLPAAQHRRHRHDGRLLGHRARPAVAAAEISRVFVALGWIYVLVIALLGVFFATGYYNLTAVELIAAVLIFSWIIVFLRTASADREHGPRGEDLPARGEERSRGTTRPDPLPEHLDPGRASRSLRAESWAERSATSRCGRRDREW